MLTLSALPRSAALYAPMADEMSAARASLAAAMVAVTVNDAPVCRRRRALPMASETCPTSTAARLATRALYAARSKLVESPLIVEVNDTDGA